GGSVPALPQRAVSRGALPGQPRALAGRRRLPLVGGPASAAYRGFQPDQPGDYHAGVSSNRWIHAGGAGIQGQTGAERPADRGRRGLLDDAEELNEHAILPPRVLANG